MADNPPINENGVPLRVSDEMFVLERKNVEILVKIDSIPDWGKRSATGTLYMTTCRMVFVNGNHAKSDFKSFDMPLFNIFGEKFEQPIFGSNYLQANIKPLYNLIPGNAICKLWFKSGGCEKFLKVFDVVLKDSRQCRSRNQMRDINQRVQSGQFANNAAFSDPSDPSIIYVSQPQFMADSNQYFQNPQFYQQMQGQQIGTNYQQPIQQQQVPPPNPNQFDPTSGQVPNYNYPPLNPDQQQQNQQNQQQQIQQPLQQQHIQQPQQQQAPNAAFYFGFFGPKLQRTDQ